MTQPTNSRETTTRGSRAGRVTQTARPSAERAVTSLVELQCERCGVQSAFRGIQSRAKAQSLHALVCREREDHNTSPMLVRIDGQRPRLTHLYS